MCTVNDDEERLFLDEMSGVVPLKREPRVRRDTRRQADGESADRRREAAVAGPASDGNPLSDDDRFVEPLDPWYVLDFKRPRPAFTVST